MDADPYHFGERRAQALAGADEFPSGAAIRDFMPDQHRIFFTRMPYLAPITAGLSLPFTFFISNDAFYFGVLPVLSQVGGHYGVTPLEMARASLMGQPFHLLSPLVPSTYLLVSLAGVELGDHQRHTFGWAIATAAVMSLAAMATLAFPLLR